MALKINTMRKYFWLFLIVGCVSPTDNYISHGDKIDSKEAISIDRFLNEVSESRSSYKVKATIEEVCQMKGCWMTLRNEEGANIRVTFKDYGFFVPKDISGKEVIIEGLAQKEVLEEDMARHYAEDGGKEYNDSMRNTISFVAHGVLGEES